jgi:hypothetical protein
MSRFLNFLSEIDFILSRVFNIAIENDRVSTSLIVGKYLLVV